MVHGRIEPTPAQQLIELRKARDRYVTLAERLHESAEPGPDPERALAEERDARRIANAYEKSITNSVARMSSMGRTHKFARPSLGAKTWLAIFMTISAIEGALLLAYFHPAIFQFRLTLPQLVAAKAQHHSVSVAALPKSVAQQTRPPPLAASLKPVAQQMPPPAPNIAPVIAPVIATVIPVPRPFKRAAAKLPPVAAAPIPQSQILQSPNLQSQAPRPPILQSPILQVPAFRPPTLQPPTLQPSAPPPVAAAPQAPAVQPQTPPQVAAVAAPPLAPPPPRPTTTVATTTTPAVPPPTKLEPIARTHTPPPYPASATSLGEAGTTVMRLAISALGAATDCTVAKSSGSMRLDATACDYVQAHWRWKPATRDGQPVTASAEVTIVWNLRDAR